MHEPEVADLLCKMGIEYIVSLPCDRTKGLCSVLEERFRYITIPREEDGIGICSGLALAGKKSVLHMQSSGIGNSLNAIMTLPVLYRLPLVILASWRGFYEEKIEAQIPFNAKIPDLLALYGIACSVISEPGEIDRIRDSIADGYGYSRVQVVLISPRIWDGDESSSEDGTPSRERQISLTYQKTIQKPLMQRADAIRVIAGMLTDELVISNIGIPSRELYEARDRAEHFYMLGSYSQATPIGLGLALGTRKKIVVLDGDGSMLATSVLPVVGEENTPNLTIICLDNGAFGSTGNQCTPACRTVDLELVARACGITRTWHVHTPEELVSAFGAENAGGSRFIHVMIRPGNTGAPVIPLTAEEIRNRFIAGRG